MLIVPAHAKVNLALDVVTRRPDGWHDIDSVLTPIDWHDLVGVWLRAAERTTVRLRVTGPASNGVPEGDANLAVRAAHAAVEAARTTAEVRIWLDKRVPFGAGLGGGSADAAALLIAMERLLAPHATLDSPGMLAAAMTVGSDVPALVAGGAQRVTGRGEHLSQVAAGTLHLVVVSTEPSSTRDTYACVDPTELGGSGRVSRLVAALAAGEPPLDGLLGSALEPAAGRASAAVAAWIRRVRSALPDVSWHLTGSGGAVFAVLPDARRAAELASRARQGGLAARACRTLASPG